MAQAPSTVVEAWLDEARSLSQVGGRPDPSARLMATSRLSTD
jgi:hypothetical protein